MKTIIIAAAAMLAATSASAQIVCFPGDTACQSQQAADSAMRSASQGPGLLDTIIGGIVEQNRQDRIKASVSAYENAVAKTPEDKAALNLAAMTEYAGLMKVPAESRATICEYVRKANAGPPSVHACIQAGYLSFAAPETPKQKRARLRDEKDVARSPFDR